MYRKMPLITPIFKYWLLVKCKNRVIKIVLLAQ